MGRCAMRKKLGKLVLPVAAACMLVFAIFHVVKAQQKPPRPPPPVEPARTPFGKTVAGAGIVEARTQNIAIGTALPGLVLEVYVPVDQPGGTGRPQTANVERAPFGRSPGPRVVAGDPQDLVGKTVRNGDPLFLVDNRQLRAQLKYNEANIA